MYNIKCRCGKRSTNFKKNIGEFYIDTCCMIAGYDELGNKPEEPKRRYRPSGNYSSKKIESDKTKAKKENENDPKGRQDI